MDKKLVLVTGATGYIASRLIPELLRLGYNVRCLVRNSLRLKARSWFPFVEIIHGDVMHPSTLAAAMEGVHTAYYLIHNMSSGQGYTSLEQGGAKNFTRVAELAGVKHIIYLGGLADPQGKISSHMRSRIETGERLRAGQVPVTEFRAGVIVGPGSISFEMIRFITELMPLIIGPVWLRNLAQPIAAKNVLDYLLAALENEPDQSRVFEIGGPDRISYARLMLTYGRIRGLRRHCVVLPGIPLWFMALGVEWITPVPAVIATPLVDGMRSESIVRDDSVRQVFPGIRLIGYEEAVGIALGQLRPDCIEPVWSGCERPTIVLKHEGFFIDHRCARVNATPEKVFRVISAMGGENGWPYGNWLWKLRAQLDRIFGGPGMRSRSPEPGGDSVQRATEDVENKTNGNAVVDFYRVEAVEEGCSIRLYSELKAPGEGWMEWRVEKVEQETKLSQTGYFAPRGFLGFSYWAFLAPFHRLVFRGMLRAIVRQSEE